MPCDWVSLRHGLASTLPGFTPDAHNFRFFRSLGEGVQLREELTSSPAVVGREGHFWNGCRVAPCEHNGTAGVAASSPCRGISWRHGPLLVAAIDQNAWLRS